MTEATDNIRMPNAIEGDRLILKILDQRSLQVGIEIILEEYIKCFYDDESVWRVMRRKHIAGQKDLGVAALPEPLLDVVSFVEP